MNGDAVCGMPCPCPIPEAAIEKKHGNPSCPALRCFVPMLRSHHFMGADGDEAGVVSFDASP